MIREPVKKDIMRIKLVALLSLLWATTMTKVVTVDGFAHPIARMSIVPWTMRTTLPALYKKKQNNDIILALKMYKDGGMSNDEDGDGKVDENQEELFYNDFDFVIGGDDTSSNDSTEPLQDTANMGSSADSRSTSNSDKDSFAMLQQRINSVQYQQQQVVAENFNNGDWTVRGISLDPEIGLANDDDDDNRSRIEVTALSQQVHDDLYLLIGRSDGSILLLELGTEFYASFEHKWKLTTDADMTSAIPTQTLQRQPTAQNESKGTAAKNADNSNESSTPFQLLAQAIDPTNTAIFKLMWLDTDNNNNGDLANNDDHPIFVSLHQNSNSIQVWQVHDLDDSNAMKIVPARTLTTSLVNNNIVSPIVDIKQLDNNDIIAVTLAGQIHIWNVHQNYQLTKVVAVQLPSLEATTVSSFAIDDEFVYIGLNTGQVAIVVIDDIPDKNATPSSQQQVQPKLIFDAHGKQNGGSGVSSILATGIGSLGATKTPNPTRAITTGSTDGSLKQWEIIMSRSTNNDNEISTLQHWPKLPSQTFSNKSHVVLQPNGGKAITSIQIKKDSIDTIIACTHESVMVCKSKSDNQKGGGRNIDSVLFTMDGFDGLTSLVLTDSTMITNGMKHFVCIHDFDKDPYEVDETDYDLGEEW